MAIGRLDKSSIDAKYDEMTEYERNTGKGDRILQSLILVFMISQSEEVISVSDFLGGRNLPMTECFEDLNAGYELIKMGMNKNAFISLRTGLDNGLLAAYWKAWGYNTKEFRAWLRSEVPTPQKTKDFWGKIMEIDCVKKYNKRFPLRKEIDKTKSLDNYVHTRGTQYATTMELQKTIKARNENIHYDEWFNQYSIVISLILKLQLLVNPKLSMLIPEEVLLRKFATYDRIPFMGILIGDNSSILEELIGKDEYNEICLICRSSKACKEVQDFLKSFPDFSDKEIMDVIMKEQKIKILDNGFAEWYQNSDKTDSRIDMKMKLRLQSWVEAVKNGS